MKVLLKSFEKILIALKENGHLKHTVYLEKLENIHVSMSKSGKKIFSAAKFIDFFVHDILDYSMLQKNSESFLKKQNNFDIRDAINEIIDIEHDKIKMKQLKVT